MASSPMVGARVPKDWQQQIQAFATASGRKEAFVVRFAFAQYLGRTDPGSVKGAITALDDRVKVLERKARRVGEIGGLK